MFFDKKGLISRLTVLNTDSDKEDYQIIDGLRDVNLHIQPASNETVALVEGVFGKTYTIFTTQSGIKDGDRLTISGLFTDGQSLNKYIQVKNVGAWSFQPLPHFEIVCVDIEEQ